MDGDSNGAETRASEPPASALVEDRDADVTNGHTVSTQTSASDPFKADVALVTESEIGIQTLLNRLKQSIASAKEFASYLQQRSKIEDQHAQQLRKACRSTHEALKRPECRGGSFLSAYDDITRIEEAMAENGIKFSLSLHQMHDDLSECVANVDKARKVWKSNGLTAEQRHVDTESAMHKAKNKYVSIAEDYDRARTGDGTKRVFGLKGPKSMEQREEELLRKVQAADGDYAQKVQTAQSSRAELLSRGRPEAVKNLLDLIKECDSALSLQMQKYSSFNERLLLQNGLAISPLRGQDSTPSGRSLRDIVASIDNDRDMNYYIASQASKVPPKPAEIKYERHSVLNPVVHPPSAAPQGQRQSEPLLTHNSVSTTAQQAARVPPALSIISSQNANIVAPVSSSSPLSSQQPIAGQGSYLGQAPATPSYASNPLPQRPAEDRAYGQGSSPFMQSHDRNTSAGHSQTRPGQYNTSSMGAAGRNGPPPQYSTGSLGSSGPPQLSNLPFQPSQGYMGERSLPQNTSSLPPLKPVFGLTLEQLFERDGSAVPMIVYQCIQAIDLFGLEVEGIYRLSGTSSHINKIKATFDNDASKVDFRNPENFFHDVNSVAGLLKQFFRDLPDPLLTTEHYAGFIEAAKHDDDVVRRDSLHAIINSLPDPNYATLRALTLHLNRVQENSSSNRMNASNLAIVFGPTLMGANTGPNIQDAGWQVRVIDTILNNTYQIFDDD